MIRAITNFRNWMLKNRTATVEQIYSYLAQRNMQNIMSAVEGVYELYSEDNITEANEEMCTILKHCIKNRLYPEIEWQFGSVDNIYETYEEDEMSKDDIDSWMKEDPRWCYIGDGLMCCYQGII